MLATKHALDDILKATCWQIARVDQQCFELGTDPSGAKLFGIFGILGQKISNMSLIYDMLDLDKDGKVSKLETSAWLKRNEYIVCRPFRNEILAGLKQEYAKSFSLLIEFLDADRNGKINVRDVSSLFTVLHNE